MEKTLYHITDEKGHYFTTNDFNGRANFLPPNVDGTPPCIAFAKYKEECDRKIFYLSERTSRTVNGDKGYWANSFIELKMVPKQIENE